MRLQNNTKTAPFFMSCKISEFFEKSPLSEAGKHPDFQVTSCLHFDSTNVDYRTNGLFVINVTLRVRVLTKLPVRPITVCNQLTVTWDNLIAFDTAVTRGSVLLRQLTS